MGDSIRYGAKLLKQTQIYAKNYVGNGLNCTSCHLNGGTTAYASPWVGIWGVFPEYRSRNGKVNTLEDRINDCLQRSMNGKAVMKLRCARSTRLRRRPDLIELRGVWKLNNEQA